MVYALNISDKFAPAKLSTIGQLLNVILPLMTIGGGLIFLVMILLGAFKYITNGDNPEALKKANATMVFAGIGLLIVVLSFVAVKLLGTLLGVNNILP